MRAVPLACPAPALCLAAAAAAAVVARRQARFYATTRATCSPQPRRARRHSSPCVTLRALPPRGAAQRALTCRGAQAGVPLPPLPSVSDAERALLDRKRLLERAWRASPYFLPLPSAKTGASPPCVYRRVTCASRTRIRRGMSQPYSPQVSAACADARPRRAAADDDGVERYSDRYKPSAVPGRAPLSAFLTWDSRYVPSELYRRRTGAGRGGAGRGGRSAPWLTGEGAAGGDMLRLERLAEAERRAAERGAADGDAGDDDEDAIRAPGGATKRPRRVVAGDDDEDGGAEADPTAAGAEPADGDGDEEAAEDDEDADDEDDYGGAAGGAFDDDEDFADDLGGGDDDGGATY